MPITATLALAVAIDLVAITILAGPLYFRRHRRRDLMLSYVALNVGVLGVAIALSGSQVGVGLGLGLFGVLSIVRLRSDQISQAEIAYYFTALALGLLSGIGRSSLWMPALFATVLLLVLYVVDHPRLLRAQHRRIVTLDRAYLDPAELRAAVENLVHGTVTRLEVLETDLVRDTTAVDVRYRVTTRPTPPAATAPWDWQRAMGSGPVRLPAPFPGGANGSAPHASVGADRPGPAPWGEQQDTAWGQHDSADWRR